MGQLRWSFFRSIKQRFNFRYDNLDDIIESVVGGYLDPDTVCTAISACPWIY